MNQDMSIFQWRRVSLGIGIVALGLGVAGWIANPSEFFLAYLFAWLVWLGVSLGSAGWVMIHHLTNGRWGYSVRRIFESAMGMLPILAILFVPIPFGLRQLYPWADPVVTTADKVLQHKLPYLNPAGFTLRAAILFAIWIWMARLLARWSAEQDAIQSVEPTKKLRKLSGPGLVIYPLTVTFACVDWVMSMEADWYSTVFPLLICIGQMLSALAFAVIVLNQLSVAPDRSNALLKALLGKESFHHLGNLLLAFTMVWAYLAYSQLIVIWSGDLPHEISWYLHRIAGGWRWIAIILLLFHFFGPFLFLLFRATKQSAHSLVAIAAVIFGTHVVDVWWLVAPSIYQHGLALTWLAPVIFLGIGGIWFAGFLTNLKSTPIVPLNDPRFAVALSTT